MLDLVIADAETSEVWAHRLYLHHIAPRRRLYLQDLCEITVGPAPLALTEQLAVDKYAIYGRQAFPSAV